MFYRLYRLSGGHLIFQNTAWNLNLILIILCSPSNYAGNLKFISNFLLFSDFREVAISVNLKKKK